MVDKPQNKGAVAAKDAAGNKTVVTLLVVVVCFMGGFSFALVPLYDMFCEITGLNGKTDTSAAEIGRIQADLGRTVKVQFLTNLGHRASWEFRAKAYEMEVHPGQLYETSFYARNLMATSKVAQAIPSVSPGSAAEYFKKTECFCFTRQVFEAGEERDMPLRFMIDPDLPDNVQALALAYTFFEVDNVVGNDN